MIYIADAQGTIKRVITASVNQNSNLANKVILLAPFPNAEVTVAFTLPNGVHTTESLATPNMVEFDLDGIIESASKEEYGLWEFLMPSAITAIAGQVQVQFYIYLGNNQVLTTSPAVFTVAKGVPSIFPQEPSNDIYTQILGELTRINANIGSGRLMLSEVEALPTADISLNTIYVLTQELNGVAKKYYYIYADNAWRQLNASYITVSTIMPGQSTLPNGLYVNKTLSGLEQTGTALYIAIDGQVIKLVNQAQYNSLNTSLGALNTELTNVKTDLEDVTATATQASETAGTAKSAADNAQLTADEALQKANSVSSALRFGGNATLDTLPALTAENVGLCYNMVLAFATTANFVEGAGKSYPAGTNVAVVSNSGTIKYDVLAGVFDLSGYQLKLVSGQNIKTINGQSVLGSGNIAIKEVVSSSPLYDTGVNIPVTLNANGTAFVRLQVYNGESE